MSRAYYTVNDDVYGKILKTKKESKTEADYAEVFEAVEGLGIYIFIDEFQLPLLSVLLANELLPLKILCYCHC